MSQLYLDLRHDFFRVCVFVTINALLCNFLPSSARLRNHPRARYWYEVLVSLMSGFALNWRTCLPSLDREFIGFQRTVRHTYRNWRQDRLDHRYYDPNAGRDED